MGQASLAQPKTFVFVFSDPEEGKSNFVEPTVIRFSEKDAVTNPYGDPKNIPFTDDNIIIITGGFMLTLQSSKSQILYLLIFKVKKDR